MKRGTTNYNFLLGIDKPSGISSHDVVNHVRHKFGEGRVGHMGTLDPLASGVMIVGVGPSARLNSILENHDKTYLVTVVLGYSTNTYDVEGEVCEELPVTNQYYDEKFASETVKKFIGKQKQIPPAYSAIKIDGVASYKNARRGKNIDLPAREIEVYDAQLIKVDNNAKCEKFCSEKVLAWTFRVSVSKGTYIRSLVNDLGQKLGCGAFVSELRRESVGNVVLDDCVALADFDNAVSEFPILSTDKVLAFKEIDINDDQYSKLKNGNSIHVDNLQAGKSLADNSDNLLQIKHQDKLVSIASINENLIKPEIVFPDPLQDKNTWNICPALKNSVVTFGVFDGVHEGHQYLIQKTVDDAKTKNFQSGIITFNIDPDELFVNDFIKLLSNEERIAQLKNTGVDFVYVLDFNKIRDYAPEDFLNLLFLDNKQTPSSIHVGSNFYFGKRGSGDTKFLSNWGKQHNMDVNIHELLTKNGKVISSSNIRRCII